MAFSYFLESQLGLGLQLYPVYQEILLGSHEEDKARASLVLPQCILQPLPGMNRVGTRGLDLARRYREGTLTYPDTWRLGQDPERPQRAQKELENTGTGLGGVKTPIAGVRCPLPFVSWKNHPVSCAGPGRCCCECPRQTQERGALVH